MDTVKNISKYKTYYSTACSVCLSTENIKRCSSCKITPYCSNEHQKSNWKTHKYLCKAIAKSMKVIIPSIKDFNDWRDYRYSLKVAWESTLDRKLKLHENLMWMFLRACSICFKMENLEECPNCLMVSYCNEHNGHHKVHLVYCEDLKLCHAIDRYLIENNVLPSIELKQSVSTKILPNTFTKFICLMDEEIGNDNVVETLKHWSVDLVGTIIYGLHTSGVYINEKLILHIVGASNHEMQKDWGNLTEIMFHWFSNVREITFYLIGPDVVKNNVEPEDYQSTFCSSCKRKSCSFRFLYYKEYLHECFDYLEKPDAVFVFNSGISENEYNVGSDTWKYSLEYLIKYINVPTILTAYTLQEAVLDLRRFDTFKNVQYIIQHQKNPYRSTRPFRDWSTENEPIYFNDNYISIIKRYLI